MADIRHIKTQLEMAERLEKRGNPQSKKYLQEAKDYADNIIRRDPPLHAQF